ncbi:hypothetical protein OIO90_000538 [Microbotryomycetes sp. JL221]|nr:hypothetical protein OIO90_000538 [Microbotryomycetes sp. JL221]
MSDMYKQEVPLYGQLLDLVRSVNEPLQYVLTLEEQQRLTQERHGAIRVGKPSELRNLARLFHLLGMEPIGYYDLSTAGLPVHATAFRPTTTQSLAENPFRVFTSLLRLDLIEDEQTRALAKITLAKREIFSKRALEMIDQAEARGGVSQTDASEFVNVALQTFAFNVHSLVSEVEYDRLRKASPLVADIASFATPHINHLTPCTLDIDQVQQGMLARGIPPKSIIEGPPARECPILLRQTSFTALEEPIVFPPMSNHDSLHLGAHKARFGEIEARGAALTRKGRALFDDLFKRARETEVDVTKTSHGDEQANEIHQNHLKRFFAEFPDNWEALRQQGLVFVRYEVASHKMQRENPASCTTLDDLVAHGLVTYKPIIYEDFLPASAAGIFTSNLGATKAQQHVGKPDQVAFEKALGRPVLHADTLYRQMQDDSIKVVLAAFPGVRV